MDKRTKHNANILINAFLLVSALCFFDFGVQRALAFDYQRTPNTSDVVAPVSISFEFDTLEYPQAENCLINNPPCSIRLFLTGVEGEGFADIYGTVCQILTPGINTISDSFTANNGGVEGVGFDLSYASENCVGGGSSIEIEYDGGNFVFSFVSEIMGGSSSIWAGSNGFWGSTTAGDVAGTLTASVQNTGVNIYALMSFVGIPLAFLLALWLISLINKQLTPEKKEEKKGAKYEFIEHTPQDLELQREYGHVEKRKRGRPRKTL